MSKVLVILPQRLLSTPRNPYDFLIIRALPKQSKATDSRLGDKQMSAVSPFGRSKSGAGYQTGSSAFRLDRPIRSTAMPTYGPITGAFRAKLAMVPRKSPNSTMMP